MATTNTLTQKYRTLKAKKSSLVVKKPPADDVFSHQHLRSSSSPVLSNPTTKTKATIAAEPSSATTITTSTTPTISYPIFIAELISAFNSLSASSSAPTSSPLLHTFFQGADHEAHVDGQQKKKVVKALQHADPAKVNEIIALLKAMPDPTINIAREASSATTAATTISTVSMASPGKNDKKDAEKRRLQKQKEDQLDKELEEWDKVDKKWSWETQKSNDQLTGVVDPESRIGITSPSWWFASSPPSSPTPTDVAPTATMTKKVKDTKDTPLAKETATGFGSLWLNAKSKPSIHLLPSSSPIKAAVASPSVSKPSLHLKKSLSTGEQIAVAAASLLAIAAISKPKESKSDTSATASKKSSTLHRQSSLPMIRKASLKTLLPTARSASTDSATTVSALKKSKKTEITSSTPSYLTATINSITRQFMASQLGPPSLHMISAYTFWWGYEIYVPHKCMDTIERVSNTSQIFFNILSSAISGIPGLAALVPIAKIISAWVGYQWSVIKAEDLGKGVVISATWVLPVALASRSWDHSCHHLDGNLVLSPSEAKKTFKSKLKLIGN
ncbi:hypothetical protein EDD11_008866 [Mortierella claussenii]|nr:hypothetical protein EDD11_008866 [Mortierella claussenii]